jgi:integrase/recombinase XerD
MYSSNYKKVSIGDMSIPKGFGVLGECYFDYMAVNQFSPRTIESKRYLLGAFSQWCKDREIERPEQITQVILKAYQRHLHLHRQANDKPLSVSTQIKQLTDVKVFLNWLATQSYLVISPARDFDLPKRPQRLPKHTLSISEVEVVMALPDCATALGLRDRAIMEVFYSTAIRRLELIQLDMNDVDKESGVIRIRHGKGDKERVTPIGERALYWISRYLNHAREKLLKREVIESLFITQTGKPMSPSSLTRRVQRYVKESGINKTGSCHLFRHSTATLMLENNADIRIIQSMLGHTCLSSTQIYTNVSIKHLKEVHQLTHPAKMQSNNTVTK